MIAIVDYGAGNLCSVQKAFDWLGKENAITSDPERLPVWAVWVCVKPLGMQSNGVHHSWVSA